MRCCLQTVLCVVAAGHVLPAQAQSLPNGVASGDVTANSAVLWSRSTALGDARFEVATDPGFAELVSQADVTVTDADVPVKADVEGLEPGTRYYYQFTNSDGDTASGHFKTPAVGTIAGFRMGVSGDWRGDLAPFPAVTNVPGRDLDLFVALGDTVYADVASPDVPAAQATTLDEFRAKHSEVYAPRLGLSTLADLRASSALLATIDDHEISNDFAGGAPPDSDPRFDIGGDYINETALYRNALQAFSEFNPLRDEAYGDTGDSRTADKLKLYRYRTYGLDAAIFILDTRSFRDEPLQSLLPLGGLPDPRAFLQQAFTPGRTMLGAAQLAELQADLLDAQQAGVTWKFVLIPEPIQNLGPILAADRYEGYAAERAVLLEFIDTNTIRNVVFIAADIHGTVVNNLTYRPQPEDALRQIPALEVTTGAVAYAAPFGPTVFTFVDLVNLGFLGDIATAIYNVAGREFKNTIIQIAGDLLLGQFGYDSLGLDGAPLAARLTRGGWVAVHTFGWTELDVSPASHELTVTTYGIDWYTAEEIENDGSVLQRAPRIVSQFVVEPDCGPPNALACAQLDAPQSNLCGLSGVPLVGLLCGLTAGRAAFQRRRRVADV